MYTIRLNEKLYLALILVVRFNANFFNTNDLAQLANKYHKELVRAKKFKKDYKYFEDTNFGGFRGNLSTILTLRGLVKRGSRIIATYSVGDDFRLKNAVKKGDIVFGKDFTVKTNNLGLKNLLERVDKQHSLKEFQAHVKKWLEKDKSVPLLRDNSFPKDAVFKTQNDKFFFRILFNRFIDDGVVLEYHLLNYWTGDRVKQKNIHVFFAVPVGENPFGKLYAIKSEDLFANKPLFLEFDNVTGVCKDKNGKLYNVYEIKKAADEFSDQYANDEVRLSYKWSDLREKFCEEETEAMVRNESEANNFISLFLDWNRRFKIDNKEVVDVIQIGSSGPDIELVFSGGTKQKLELEHSWHSYLNHGHQNNNAFNGAWIFSEEEFDFKKIIKLFGEEKKKNGDRIPNVFLSVDKNGKRHVHSVDWCSKTFKELQVKF